MELLAPLLDIVVTLDPHHIAAYRFGAIFLPERDRAAAINLLERGIKANPTAWRLYQDIAYIYWQEGDYTQAARYAQEATAKRSDWFFNYYLLAACQAAAGNLAAAQKALQHGQAFGPYSLNALRMGHPFAQPDMAEKFVGFLQQAGWEG